MTAERVKKLVYEFRALKNENNLLGMARYGIDTSKAFGLPIPFLRNKAKEIGKNHTLALALWKEGFNETKILAALIDDPRLVDGEQMEAWVREFNSWDVCDQVCCNLFDKTALSLEKASSWMLEDDLFVKRAGFVLIAALAVHDKRLDDQTFLRFIPCLRSQASDDRNYVRKAVNWAIRQIGKRNGALNRSMIELAEELFSLKNKTAGWIARDALRELLSDKVQLRLSSATSKSRSSAVPR